MPTGYTNKLYNGEQSFREFVLGCVKAFFVDGIIDFEIPEYYVERVTELEKNFDWFNSLSPEEIEIEYHKAIQSIVNGKIAYANKQHEMEKRYKKMLEEVSTFEMPEQYRNLKNFMIQQLEDSLRYDIVDQSSETLTLSLQTRSEWEASFRKYLENELTHAKEKLEEYRVLVKTRKEWYDGLLTILDEYETKDSEGLQNEVVRLDFSNQG